MAWVATAVFVAGTVLAWRLARRLRDQPKVALWAALGALALLLTCLYVFGFSRLGANVPWDDFVFFERLPIHLPALFILGLCWYLPTRVSRGLIVILIVIAGGYGLLEVSGPLLMPVYGARLDDTVAGPAAKYVQVTQSTGWTCGPAALAWALQLKGVPATERQMAMLTATTPFHGTPDRGVIRAAHRLGLKARVVRQLSYEQLRQLPRPALVVWNLGGMVWHFIVLIDIDERGVKVGDPMRGEMEYTRAEFLDKWQRSAVVFE